MCLGGRGKSTEAQVGKRVCLTPGTPEVFNEYLTTCKLWFGQLLEVKTEPVPILTELTV